MLEGFRVLAGDAETLGEGETRAEGEADADAVQLLLSAHALQRGKNWDTVDRFSGTSTTAPKLLLPQSQAPPVFVPGG